MNRETHRSISVIGWFFLLLSAAGCLNLDFSKPVPEPKLGVLNLDGWDFFLSGPIAPKGTWSLYKNRLLAMSEPGFESAFPVDAYVHVPGSWSNFKDLNGESLPAFGYMTFHLKIINSNPLSLPAELVIYFPHIRSAAELTIRTEDGPPLIAAASGQVGTSRETHRSWFGALEGAIGPRGVTHVFLQISNYDDAAVQGVHEEFYIGTREQIAAMKISRRNQDFITLGMIIFAGVFMLAFFPLRRSEFAPLWLGLFSLTFALRTYVLRLYAFEQLNDFRWFDGLFRVNYLTVCALCITYLAFLRSVFPKQFSWLIARSAYAFCLLYAVTILATPPHFFSNFFELFIVFLFLCLIWVSYGQVKALIDRQDILSVMTLLGSTIIVLSAGFDIIVSLTGSEFRNVMQIGITLNILCMSIVVSVHNASERNRVEKLTAELSQEVDIRRNAEKEISMLYQQVADRVMDTNVKLKSVEKVLQESEHKTEIADLTTGTLHNVKNVLTSVKTSTELLAASMNGQFNDGFRKAVGMLNQKMDFFVNSTKEDPKAILLLDYFLKLDDLYESENSYNRGHLARILTKIQAIEEIINSQQRYGGVMRHEAIDPVLVLEDALTMQLGSMSKRQIRINRQIEAVPMIHVEKVKLLHVLINLIKNAVEAMSNTPRDLRIVTVKTKMNKETLQIVVKDNGHGIAAENMDKLFSRGFTTKREGHGFGLNSSLNYVNEMGGNIRCESMGQDRGATFFLEFTVQTDPKEDHETAH